MKFVFFSNFAMQWMKPEAWTQITFLLDEQPLHMNHQKRKNTQEWVPASLVIET